MADYDFSDSDGKSRLELTKKGHFNIEQFKEAFQQRLEDSSERKRLFNVIWELLSGAIGGEKVWRWITDYYELDKTFPHIAKRARKSPTAIRMRVHRAREILKRFDINPKHWQYKDASNRRKKSRSR